MQNVTPQDFQEWKSHPVTLKVMEAIRNRIDEAKDNLISATNSREFDLWMKGFIHGMYELLDVKLAVSLEEIDTDEVHTE